MGRTWKKRPETRAKVRRKIEYQQRARQARRKATAGKAERLGLK
ncbi:hypothetical protein [Halomonas tibetensis]|uniref:Uncharacterized protein n=1 Tax=Halomonas tibetensis TaxID=2259590 RepID=A0ABV7B9V3_9GAMM